MVRILIVEDDQPIRDLYELLFRQAGYEVDTAEDGEDGFLKAVKGGYDIILLDIMLPKKDGITFLKELKKVSPQKKNKKVVMLTVLDQDEFIKTALSLGAAGYLIKPTLRPDEILAEIKTYLEQED